MKIKIVKKKELIIKINANPSIENVSFAPLKSGK